MTRPYDSDGDDCAEALRSPDIRPALTLTGYQAQKIKFALEAADRALLLAEGSKLRLISGPARAARAGVISAWAELKEPRKATELCSLCGAETGISVHAPVASRTGYAEGFGQICAKCLAAENRKCRRADGHG